MGFLLLWSFGSCRICHPAVVLRLPLQDANGHLLKIGGFAPNFPASSGKKINIRGFFGDVQKGNFEFSAQTDPRIWEIGAG